jgi:hypothetical protein
MSQNDSEGRSGSKDIGGFEKSVVPKKKKRQEEVGSIDAKDKQSRNEWGK